MRPEFHNVLTNPLPYNIQNPYILKEMTGLKTPSSYLAMKGSQNLKLGWMINFMHKSDWSIILFIATINLQCFFEKIIKDLM